MVVTGATGNVGTSLLDALCREPSVESVLGLARRVPDPVPPRWATKVSLAPADVVTDDLTPLFAGAGAVVHLAWLIQPSHRPDVLRAANVVGSERVFRAALAAGVPTLVHASSVGAYSPGPKDRAVDESWPTGGIASSFYACHKAEVERILDRLEAEHPSLRVVRMRPGLIFKREAASSVRRLFLGRLVPSRLLGPSRLPLVPRVPGLVVQAVHSDDVARAYLAAVTGEARGAYNLAADPVLDADRLAEILGARTFRLPARPLRAGVNLTWALRLQPTPPGWLDMARAVPVLDCARARHDLGWSPRVSAGEALTDLLEGLAERAEGPTPHLRRRSAPPREAEAREAAAVAAG